MKKKLFCHLKIGCFILRMRRIYFRKEFNFIECEKWLECRSCTDNFFFPIFNSNSVLKDRNLHMHSAHFIHAQIIIKSNCSAREKVIVFQIHRIRKNLFFFSSPKKKKKNTKNTHLIWKIPHNGTIQTKLCLASKQNVISKHLKCLVF